MQKNGQPIGYEKSKRLYFSKKLLKGTKTLKILNQTSFVL
jgi:hypothetical protein